MSIQKILYGFFLFPITSISSAIEIPPIYVKSKLTQNRSLTSGPQVNLTHDEIHASGINTLSQALTTLGTIQLQDTVGNASQTSISMRGFGTNATSNTLVLINGIPLANPDLAGVNLNLIPLNDIERIEIVAGTESVLYGDEAVAGIVNIETRVKSEKLVIVCTAGSYDHRDCYFSFYNHFLNQPYAVSISKTHSDNYRHHNKYDQALIYSHFKYLNGNNELSFEFNLAKENMQYPGALNATQMRQNRRQAQNNSDFFQDTSGMFHLQYNLQLTNDWRFSSDFAIRDMQGNGVLFSSFDQSRMIYFIKPQWQGTIKPIHIRFGADFEYDQYRLASALGLTNEHQQKYSLFALGNVFLSQMLKLTMGIRGATQAIHLISSTSNYTQMSANASTIGITYQPSRGWQGYLRRASSFRFPKADENASLPKGVNSLRPQRGISYETGIEWQNDRNLVQLGLYQLNLRDEIAFDPTQTIQQPFGSNQNLPPTKRVGLTVSGKTNLFRQFSVNAQYNYVNPHFQSGPNSGKRIPLVAKQIVRSGITYNIRDNLNIYAETLFTGNQYPANDNANVSGHIGGYTQVNLSIHYKLKQVEANLRINNLFNKYYYLYTAYQPSVNAVNFYPAPERNLMLSLKLRLL